VSGQIAVRIERRVSGGLESWRVESLEPDGSWTLEGIRAAQDRAVELAEAVRGRA
jgi:hypothetical protein